MSCNVRKKRRQEKKIRKEDWKKKGFPNSNEENQK
jgi:hypothetical protein